MAATQKDVVLRFVLNQSDFQRVKAGMETLTGLSSRLNGALSAVGIGLSAGGVAAFVKSSADAASQQRALAESLGVTVEEMSGWNYAARQSETSQEDLGKAVFHLNGLLKEGAEEGSKAAKILAAYGISSKQIRDGSIGTTEALRLIADKFNAMPNGIDKSALATDLLGDKLGRRLIPFLNLGSKGLDEMARKGEAAGAILTDKVADAVAKANDKLSAFNQTLQTQVLVGLSALFGLVEAFEGDKGIQELTDSLTSLRAELALLEQQHGQAEAGGILGALLHTGDAARILELKQQIADLTRQLEEARKKQLELLSGSTGKPKTKTGVEVDQEKLAKQALDAQKEADEQSRAVVETELILIAARTQERKEVEQLVDKYDEQAAASKELTADQQRLYQSMLDGEITWEQYQRAIEGVSGAYEELGSEDVPAAKEALDTFADQARRNMQDIVAGLLSGRDAADNFFDTLIQGLKDVAAEMAAQEILRKLFGSEEEGDEGLIYTALNLIGSYFSNSGSTGDTGSTDGGSGNAGGGMAAGGYVSGAGGPTDDLVPAMLSNGEYVINAAAVKRVGTRILDSINNAGGGAALRSQRLAYAMGGLVNGGGGVSHAKSLTGQALNFSPTYNIDARGADQAAMAQMLRAMERMNERVKADVAEALRRGYTIR